MTYKPSISKVAFRVVFFLSLALVCLFIESIVNQITFGTYIISIYEAGLFYFIALFYLVQVIPGYARLTLSDDGYEEVWFFKRRVAIKWKEIDWSKTEQQKGDSLFISSLNKQLFSRKPAIKGLYEFTIPEFFSQILQYQPKKNKRREHKYYLIKNNLSQHLIVVFTLLCLMFNFYYLTDKNHDADFEEQVKIWQAQEKTTGEIFNLFKPYGFYWKKQVKQFDRKLYIDLINYEADLIEKSLLKQWNEKNTSGDIQAYLQQLKTCREYYLIDDNNAYFYCLDRAN